MATVKLNRKFDSIKGRLGGFVHYNRLGVQCARAYVVPGNPDTPAQRINRSAFADAVKLWQGLSQEDRYGYNRRALKRRSTGYNLFISEHMKRHTSGPEGCITGDREAHSFIPLRSVSAPAPVLGVRNEFYSPSAPAACNFG